MRSSKGSPNPRYFLATLTTSRRFFSIRRRLARLSPERSFRERLTSWRRVKRTPLPIFAKYSAKSSGASKPRGAASPLSCSGSTAGAGVTVPDRTAFFLFTRLPPLFHSACLEDLRSLCRRPAPLLSSHARDEARLPTSPLAGGTPATLSPDGLAAPRALALRDADSRSVNPSSPASPVLLSRVTHRDVRASSNVCAPPYAKSPRPVVRRCVLDHSGPESLGGRSRVAAMRAPRTTQPAPTTKAA